MDRHQNFTGKFVSGKGSEDKLRLIEKSFSMLSPTPELPYMQMIWNPAADTFKEGFIWGTGFWMQNSYGFILGAAPLFDEKWSLTLQNSLDLFWDRIGDGKRIGMDSGIPDPVRACMNFCAPDGSLGDCVFEDGIVYRQGDGPFDKYDWFFEATACGILLQCDTLLFRRDEEAMKKYIPLMVRSMEFIETRRAENGLFLVGASANLLAPSFGGTLDENGTPDTSYLTGVAVTTLAAEEKLAQVAEFVGEEDLAALCRQRALRTRQALPQLLTEKGYLVKSMEKNGTRHGVYGAEKHGYLEGIANADAVALRAVEPSVRESIIAMLDSVPEIRKAGLLCCNWPALDDTASHVLAPHELTVYHVLPGNWVNGGCWATAEGRNIIACMETGRSDTAFRAAEQYMKWAEDYRQDAPLSQWGENTCNCWQQENHDHSVIGRPVSVMIDNFASVTCLIRGLFSPRAESRGLELMNNLPADITEYSQNSPIFFGKAKLFIRAKNGEHTAKLYLDGSLICSADSEGHMFIPAELLTEGDHDIYISSDGNDFAPPQPAYLSNEEKPDPAVLPPELAEIWRETEKASDSFGRTVHLMASAAALRRKLPFEKENFRPMTEEKKKAILQLYDESVKNAYNAYKFHSA